MGKMIELKTSDGKTIDAYRAEPAGKPRGAMIVIQEIWGVNRHIRKVADGYAAEGYVAIAPALFDRIRRGIEIGYSMADIQEGFGYKSAIKTEDALADIAAAVKTGASHGKVGIVGFCWGGGVVGRTAAADPTLSPADRRLRAWRGLSRVLLAANEFVFVE